MVSRAELRNYVKMAFEQLGDIPVRCLLRRQNGVPVRDFVAGTTTVPTVDYPLPMVAFVKWTQDTAPAHVDVKTHTKCLFPTIDLPAGVKPDEGDKLIELDPATQEPVWLWEVVKNMTDPAQAVGILNVRGVGPPPEEA